MISSTLCWGYTDYPYLTSDYHESSLVAGPDLIFESMEFSDDCDFLFVTICNIGDTDFSVDNGNFNIGLYYENPITEFTSTAGQMVVSSDTNIPAGECIDVSIPKVILGGLENGLVYAMLNDIGTADTPMDFPNDFPTTGREECDYSNNLFSFDFTDCVVLGDEICDNLIDDDEDGLIDAFDPDCICEEQEALVNYIPNPDFELHEGCCGDITEMSNCIDDWLHIDGSPEYYSLDCNTASQVEPVFLTTFDETFLLIGTISDITESAGVCLDQDLIAGETYTVEVRIGLPDPILANSDSNTSFSIYGISDVPDCSMLGDFIGAQPIGTKFCDTPASVNAQQLAVINSLDMPNLEFATFMIDFVALSDMQAILLSTDCSAVSNSMFYLIDYVQIYKGGLAWDYSSEIQSTDPCLDPVTLSVIDSDTLNYQWYIDSIPLLGDTFSSLVTSGVTPSYHVYVYNETGCVMIGPTYIAPGESIVYDTISICQGDNYLFDTQVIFSAGDYSNVFTNAAGCDSTVFLHVDLDQVIFSILDRKICEDETFTFGENELSIAGMYQDTFKTVKECDSIVTLHLTIEDHTFLELEDSFCTGESYSFGNLDITVPGVYRDTFFVLGGCDSIVYLTLSEEFAFLDTTVAEICNGEKYFFSGQDLTISGEYRDTLSNNSGCDSILLLELTVLEYDSQLLVRNFCIDEPFFFADEFITSSGIYKDTLPNPPGCDVVITLDATVYDVYHDTIDAQICNGETYLFQGELLTVSGVYTDSLSSIFGCDSLVTLNLSVDDILLINESYSICASDSIMLFGELYFEEGIYTDTLLALQGCDTIRTLDIIVELGSADTLNTFICDGEEYIFEDSILSEAGIYQFDFINDLGCDSSVFVHVMLTLSDQGDTSFVVLDAGESYIFGEEEYSTAGVFEQVFESSSGCDSLAFVSISIRPSDEIYIPNVFNPNSNVGNERLELFSKIDATILTYQIYDRWGNLVYEENNFSLSSRDKYWDGRFQNKLVESGVYVYKIDVSLEDGSTKTYVGDVALMR